MPYMNRRRVLVCGDRLWQDAEMIQTVLRAFLRPEDALTLINGRAGGADNIAHQWACSLENLGLKVVPEGYPADWDKYHKAAGPIRNQQMLDEGKPDLVIAFHDDLAKSKGTKDMVTRAKKAGVPVWVISHG